jgi:hypothetical protein
MKRETRSNLPLAPDTVPTVAHCFMLTHPEKVLASRPARPPFLNGINHRTAEKKDADQ